MKIIPFVAMLVLIGSSLAWADNLPSGTLGHPLGTYLMIEGTKADTAGRKISDKALEVHTVNGVKLEVPVTIELEGVASLPANTRCVLRGYESGKMIGLPSDVAAKEGLPLPQALWQFYKFFVVTSAVEPRDITPARAFLLLGESVAWADDMPPGTLGHPLKTDLMIEGTKADIAGRRISGKALKVHTVNGAKLAIPVTIELDCVASLPTNTRCVLRGYESGMMIHLPSDVAEKEGLPPSEKGWQFYKFFVVTSVIEPRDLAPARKIVLTGSSVARADDMPSGRLGHPVGTYLTIEGTRPDTTGRKISDKALEVHTVNGVKLEVPVTIELERVVSLPANTRCVLRGYETGVMGGMSSDITRNEGLPPSSIAWQFYKFFVVTSVVEPRDLGPARK